MEIRDRVVELRRVRARNLMPNPKIGGAIRRFRPMPCAACWARSESQMLSWPESFQTDACS